MTAMTTAPFTAARVQGRYRVLDEAGQVVVTLNSKAKAEARAEELNEEARAADQKRRADEELAALIEADVAMEQAMDAECPQEDAADLAALQAEWDEHPEYAEAMTPAAEVTETVENWGPDAVIVTREFDAGLPGTVDERGFEEKAPEAAQERQDAPEGDAGTSDTPAQEDKPQTAAEPVEKPAKGKGKGKTAGHTHQGQPEPHAFTTVGTKIPNHCAECGRTWAAAAHRKFREAQEGTAPEVAEGEWTPAADDTTPDGKAPAEGESSAS
jgi:hypothetical protein